MARPGVRLQGLQTAFHVWQQQAIEAITLPAATFDLKPRMLERKRAMDALRASADDFLSAETRIRASRSFTALRVDKLSLYGLIGLAAILAVLLAWEIRRLFQKLAGTYNLQIKEVRRWGDECYAHEQWLNTTLRSIGDAVIASDPGGKVVFKNRIAEQLTGWKEAEANATPLSEIFVVINERTRAALESPVDEVRRTGKIVGLANHSVLISKDGKEFQIDDSAAPIRNSQGQTVGVVLVFRDITGRRESEKQLRRLNQDLRRTNQDLQQFSYAASHDLKEPLRTVSNYLQLIRSRYSGKVLDKEAGELFDVAVAGAQRMHALVEALLEYSRSGEVGDSTLEPVPVDKVVGDAMVNLQSSISETDAAVSLGPLPVVIANPQHLTQVFENLIGNALKYRSEQPPRIAVSAAEGAQEWVFCVEDNGIGIPAEYQAQIFGIFKRLHGDEYPGTGGTMLYGVDAPL